MPVAGGQCVGGEDVFALLSCFVSASNRGTFEVGVAFDVDLKTTIPSLDATLLVHASVAAVAVLLALA